MSMDKSLKRSTNLVRQRSVLTRAERIARLTAEERWTDASRPLGLPKVKVARAVLKKVKKAAKEETGAEGAAAPGAAAPGGAAAPAAGAKAPTGKTAAAAAPAKPAGKGK